MQRKSLPSAGFTLVELLVATIIISILISLVSFAAMKAFGTGKNAARFHEEKQIEQGMMTLMHDFGTPVWPPADLRMANANDTNAPVYKYFRRVYPRYNMANLYADLVAQKVDTVNYDPAHALVFWLSGFHPDTTNPLNGHSDRMSGKDTSQQKYTFDPERLVPGLGTRSVPVNTPGVAFPVYHYVMSGGTTLFDDSVTVNSKWDNAEKYRGYLYFDSGSYATAFAPSGSFSAYKTGTTANDYFNNRDTCQIICAGQDQLLGSGGAPPSAVVAYAGADADNIASFGGSNTMQVFVEKKNLP